MPIKNPETEFLWDEVFVPMISDLNLTPVRVDKDPSGSPWMQRILSHIRESLIIVADLTLSKPNCYFEVGFALGNRTDNHVVLTCREDHLWDVKSEDPHAPKLHSDLITYPIIFWSRENLDKFKRELTSVIQNRLPIIMKEIPVPESNPKNIGKVKAVKKESKIKLEDLISESRKELREWKKPI